MIYTIRAGVVGVLMALLAMSTQVAMGADEGTGSIIGRVTNAENGSPLAFANLMLSRLAAPGDTVGTPAGGALTKTDGSYRIVVPPGTWKLVASFVSFDQKRITDIGVAAGQAVSLDFGLVPTAMRLQTVTVTALRIENSEEAVLAQQRRSGAVSDGVSAAQISRTTDNNAAEVLQRVTGVSIIGNKYVYVRGLGERYSSTTVNGVSIGTPEPNKRVVPLDLFGAGLLDNLVVQKTYTPDHSADFGGGVVNINTRDFPGREIRSFTISSAFNARTTGKDFLAYEGGSSDWLGFDDGTRDLPGMIDRIARDQKIVTRGVGGVGFSPDTIALLGDSFKNIWTRRSKSAFPAYSFSGSYGNEATLFGRQLGFLGAVSMSNGFSTYRSEQVFYKSDQGTLTAETSHRATTSEASTLWGAIGNASYRVNDFNTLAVRTMYNRSSEDQMRTYQGYDYSITRALRNTRLKYVERGMLASSVSSSSYLTFLGNATLDLRYSYSRADRDEPDRREYTYQENPLIEDDEIVGSVWVIRRDTDTGFTRMYGSMDEEERTPEANLTLPFKQWNRLESKVKIGALVKNKDRDSRWRRFAFRAPSWSARQWQTIGSLPADSLMSEGRIGGTPKYFTLEEQTLADGNNWDNYKAHTDITAAYAMVDMPLTRNLRAVAGARLEKATVKVDSYDPFRRGIDFNAPHSEIENSDILPAVNLTYAVRENANVRAAYSATVSRPDYRELSHFVIKDYVSGYQEIGNPGLKRAKIHSFDVRGETFPNASELLAGSLFYKRMLDPIEKIIRLTQGNGTYMPVNGEYANVLGGEIEARLALGRLTGRLDSFGFSGNLTLVHSKAKLPPNIGSEQNKERPLEGQSPYVFNTGVFYTSPKGATSASLLYNVFGKRLANVGVGESPNVYEQPKHTIDVTLSHRFRAFRVKLSMENILDDDTLFTQKGNADPEERTVSRVERGRSLSLAISTAE